MALSTAAIHSWTVVTDRRAASAQHGGTVQPKKSCSTHLRQKRAVKRAAERVAWRDTRGAEQEPYDSRRERRAPEGFSTRGCNQKGFH